MERLRASITVGDEGTFRAIASAATSTAMGERGPTRFATGAFREALSRTTRYPLLWQHRDGEPVGTIDLKEAAEGLVGDGTLVLSVQRAREAHDLLKAGAIDGVSIGFTAEKSRHETHAGKSVRVVEQAKLMEVSLVTFPADPAARVQTVHREWDEDAEVLAFAEEVERFTGRVFSEANLSKIRTALGTLVDLVEKVDPGHIAALGRRAARSLRKSFVYADKTAEKRAKAAHANAAVRRLEGLAVGVDIPVSDLPIFKPPQPYPTPDLDGEMVWALSGTLEAIGRLPAEARKALAVTAVKQFLVACGEAEEVGEEEDAGAEAGDRETFVHNPHVKEVGDEFHVVDDDGKVYGKHKTKADAEAQVAALMAAKGNE